VLPLPLLPPLLLLPPPAPARPPQGLQPPQRGPCSRSPPPLTLQPRPAAAAAAAPLSRRVTLRHYVAAAAPGTHGTDCDMVSQPAPLAGSLFGVSPQRPAARDNTSARLAAAAAALRGRASAHRRAVATVATVATAAAVAPQRSRCGPCCLFPGTL